jgi:AraC family transcriptional activator of pobA
MERWDDPLYQSNMNDAPPPLAAAIPAYALYGEADGPGGAFPDVLHVETISTRAALHGWRVADHRHTALAQFLWIETGDAVARLDGGAHALRAGMGVFSPPLTVHGFDFAPGALGWVLSVEAARIADDAPAGAGAIAPGPAEAAAIGALFRLLESEHGAARPARAEALARMAGLMALQFAREAAREAEAAQPAPSPNDASAALVRRYIALLEERFREHPPVARCAQLLGVSPTHLSRACRVVTGQPASALLHARLVLEARRLLVYTQMQVGEVSWALGFADAAYFTRFFAQKTGLAPSRFRAAFA